MNPLKKFKTGDYIMTKRGYFGVYYNSSINRRNVYVTLVGCTYSDDFWYDTLPTKDVRLATPKDIKAWTIKK